MTHNESILLMNALTYEEGHPRRTRHILSVYAMAQLIGTREGCTENERSVLLAASILHDIPIKRCKQLYGDASQQNQQKEAPAMVHSMLKEAGYDSSCHDRILDLVLHHHCYEQASRDPLLQILVEADLLINLKEESLPEQNENTLRSIFRTATGQPLLTAFLQSSPAHH